MKPLTALDFSEPTRTTHDRNVHFSCSREKTVAKLRELADAIEGGNISLQEVKVTGTAADSNWVTTDLTLQLVEFTPRQDG